MSLTPASLRFDLKCGKGAISPGEKCTKGAAQRVNPAPTGSAPRAPQVSKGLEKMPTKALKSHYNQLFDSLIKKYPGKVNNDNDFKKFRSWAAKQPENAEANAVQEILTRRRQRGQRITAGAAGVAAAGGLLLAGALTGRLRRDGAVFTDKELHATVKAEARRKFKVYPSAYANAWMVKEYKRRGGKFRGDALDTWFKEKWVRMSSSGRILGPCGDRTEGEGKPKCLPAAKAQRLTAAQRRTLVARKRRNDPAKNRSGAPVMVSSKTDIWATGFDAEDGKKYTNVVTNPETGRKNRIRYGAKGYKIAPGTNKGDRYCARSFGDMKSHGKDCAGADRNTPLCLSRAKWRCSGKASRRDGVITPGK